MEEAGKKNLHNDKNNKVVLSEAKIVSVFPYSVSPYVLKRDIVLIKRVCFSRSLNKQTVSSLLSVLLVCPKWR